MCLLDDQRFALRATRNGRPSTLGGVKNQIADVAFNFFGKNTDVIIAGENHLVFKAREVAVAVRPTFEPPPKKRGKAVFHLPDPSDMKYEYVVGCWDDFFVRKCADMGNTEGLGARPLNGLPGYHSHGRTAARTTTLSSSTRANLRRSQSSATSAWTASSGSKVRSTR